MSKKVNKQKFALEFIRSKFDVKATAKICKISESYAHRLVKHPEVVLEIQSFRQHVLKSSRVDKTWVINQYLDLYDKVTQAVPVEEKGEKTGEFKADFRTARSILRDIGDHLGMFDKEFKLHTSKDDGTLKVVIAPRSKPEEKKQES